MIGFSIPHDNTVLVVSYEGVHLLRLGPEITVETDGRFKEYGVYDPDSGLARYEGKEYRIIGLHDGEPILDQPDGEILLLDAASETLAVVRKGQTLFSMKYTNFSGDWAAATFSPDGRYIVLGCPYDVDFVVLQREVDV
jgi:hypothetical protein